VMNAILYMLRSGCLWRVLPKDFPTFTTVPRYFYEWRDNGLFERINFELLVPVREAAGREPARRPWVIDSQSVKTTESGEPRGYDAAKKVKGRKRYVVTGTSGLLVGVAVHPADIQDRFRGCAICLPTAVYNGPQLHKTLAKFGDWTIEIVKRTAAAAGFELLPRRWWSRAPWPGSIATAVLKLALSVTDHLRSESKPEQDRQQRAPNCIQLKSKLIVLTLICAS
jgi:putative transposase